MKYVSAFLKKSCLLNVPDCKARMSEVKYDNSYWIHLDGSDRSTRYYRECSCGCLITWGYTDDIKPAFIRRHILELFNFKETVLLVP